MVICQLWFKKCSVSSSKKRKKKENFLNNIQLTMKGLQYPANAHGLCHNVFKRLSLPQENTQKLDALGNSVDLILLFI